jgi:hypothetical protein
MANWDTLIRAERIRPEIEDTVIMREAYPELSWYWDRVDVLIERIAAYERADEDRARNG